MYRWVWPTVLSLHFMGAMIDDTLWISVNSEFHMLSS